MYYIYIKILDIHFEIITRFTRIHFDGWHVCAGAPRRLRPPTSPHQHAHGHVGVSWAGGQVGDETVLQARELHTSLREHCPGARRSKGEAAAMVVVRPFVRAGKGMATAW